jgi:hypothetical protein
MLKLPAHSGFHDLFLYSNMASFIDHINNTNGKVSHIHRRMCQSDYTEWITRSFVNKAKEGYMLEHITFV